MERLTKLTVVASNLLALWLLARLVSRGVPPILIPTIVAFVLAWLSALIAGDSVVTVILSAIYFVPALAFAAMGAVGYSFSAIWLAAVSGATLPRGVRGAWAFPPRWKPPLVFWALAIALSWPIVVLREVDFFPALINRGDLWNSRL